jgi:hypothetical protein
VNWKPKDILARNTIGSSKECTRLQKRWKTTKGDWNMEIIALGIGVIALSLGTSALAKINALQKEIAALNELIQKSQK